MTNLIKEPIVAYAAENWIFWRKAWWPNGSHRGTWLSLRLEKSPCPCYGPHGFLGADDMRAPNSDKPVAPAAPAGEGSF